MDRQTKMIKDVCSSFKIKCLKAENWVRKLKFDILASAPTQLNSLYSCHNTDLLLKAYTPTQLYQETTCIVVAQLPCCSQVFHFQKTYLVIYFTGGHSKTPRTLPKLLLPKCHASTTRLFFPRAQCSATGLQPSPSIPALPLFYH